MPRPVKILSGSPYPRDAVSARISPAQNVPFWCSIGHYSYDKIADQRSVSTRCKAARKQRARGGMRVAIAPSLSASQRALISSASASWSVM